MQNKPNLPAPQMNVSSVLTKDYENQGRLQTPGKQTQSNPISKATRNPIFSLAYLAQTPNSRQTISYLLPVIRQTLYAAHNSRIFTQKERNFLQFFTKSARFFAFSYNF
jgi:hypothetical protein